MNLTPYLHLLWKEYRAIRLFWLCLAGLAMFIQWIFAVTATSPVVALQFNLALLTPALFALGCAGTAFAIEKEEGTFDFLQSIPVTSRQLFISKLSLTVLATLAMYLVLWPVAMWFTGMRLPALPEPMPGTNYELLVNMLSLWVVAALEAIAWGTLFSLITGRPLLSICLAVAIDSTLTHLLASQGQRLATFDMASYAQVAPARLVIVCIVGAIDIYLGMNWLRRQSDEPKAGRPTAETRAIVATPLRNDISDVDVSLTSPERPTMLAHLLWQQWRQSRWLMIGLAVASIYAVAATPESVGIVFTPFLTALMGAFVFRADQERCRFRFFVEHNVPPRLVWISRQAPWLLTLLAATLVGFIWTLGYSKFSMTQLHQLDARSSLQFWDYAFYIPVAIVLAYAAGQWTSIFIRSGLLAGFGGVLLAALLCAWASLMSYLSVPWIWSVLPIPFVLMLSTWLRAPDWIRESRTWRARLTAATVALVPAGALLIAVPLVRVYGVPSCAPGFDPAEYLAEIKQQTNTTAESYRRLSAELTRAPFGNFTPIFRREDSELMTSGQSWLNANAALLPKVIEIANRDPNAIAEPTVGRRQYDKPPGELIWLVMLAADKAESEKKFAESLDDHFAALQIVEHLSQMSSPFRMEEWSFQGAAILNDLRFWAAQEGQSPASIRSAIAKLETVGSDVLHFDDSLKGEYILEQRQLASDDSMLKYHYDGPQGSALVFQDTLFRTLMPWEKYRRMRELNLMSRNAQDSLEQIQQRLNRGEPVSDLLEPHSDYFRRTQGTSILYLWANDFSYLCDEAPRQLLQFEAARRATIVILSLEAHRLEHKALPQALDELVPSYFEQTPLDPYSGRPFIYFPQGIPQPTTELQVLQFERAASYHRTPLVGPVLLGNACIWSTGPDLMATQWEHAREKHKDVVYYHSRMETGELPTYEAWGRGYWFPISDPR